MFRNIRSLVGAIAVLISVAHSAPTLIAELDYGTFAGAYSTRYNISYWQKIPFAASTAGQNRFRAPQPPAQITNGTYNSTGWYDMCPQRTVNGSEDCLFLGLYGRPWTKGQPLRPVVVTFFGGGYIEGDSYFTIPPSAYPLVNVSATSDIMFVYPNYRTNAFGLLPGKEIAADPNSDLNPALLDQHAALQWTHKYIKHFGGNPDKVSIWGASAGAGSVVAQVIAQGGQTKPKLFGRALASSPFWSKTYQYDAPQAQAIYDSLVAQTNCSGASDTLACLKALPVQAIRTAALAISASHTYNTSSYTWSPVVDGTFITQPLSAAVIKGEVNINHGFGMYNLFEGQNFIPPGLQNAVSSGSPPFNSSEASFEGWLHGFLPDLSAQSYQQVLSLYPAAGSAEGLPSYNRTYTRAGLIFRDVVLACPAYWMAGAAHTTQYLGEYTILPATHGSDTEWWNSINAVQTSDPLTYHGYAGAFASFFHTGNPNALKLTNNTQAGVPALKKGLEFLVAQDNFTKASIDQLSTRCGFWLSIASEISI